MSEELDLLLAKTKQRKESYSSLSLMTQCPYKYFLKYVKGNYEKGSTIALQIGNLCHSIMEMRKMPNQNFSYEELKDILFNGYVVNEDKQEEDEERVSLKAGEKITGLNEIMDIYWEDWNTAGRKSGLLYSQKIDTFLEYLALDYQNSNQYTVVGVEVPFEIQYKGVTIIGKIDKIEKNINGEYKITDYKTSDKVYEQKDLTTPMQMFIYALACKQLYGEYPAEFEYDFLLLGEKRQAMTKGWEKRGFKALDKLITAREEFYSTKEFIPSPTPLCYWCHLSGNNCVPDTTYKGVCDYYSLWTPQNKTFSKNREYIRAENNKPQEDEFIW